MQLFTANYASPLGQISLASDGHRIFKLHFGGQESLLNVQEPEPEIITLCKKELDEYFSGKSRTFSVPLAFEDTPFRIRVWNELQQIRYGNTISYHTLAVRLGDPKCIRAAGSANGHNPIAIIVPCHRVIGSDGSLVGYGGELWRKRWLLDHEAKYANGVQTLFK